MDEAAVRSRRQSGAHGGVAVRALIFGLAVAAASGAFAREPVRIVTGNNFEPYTDEDLPEGGVAPAIVRAVYAEMGRDVQVDFLPWKRAYQQARFAEYDAIFPYLKTAERQREFLYTEPVVPVVRRALVRSGDAREAASVADLKGTTLCLPIGYALPDSLKPHVQAGDIGRLKPQRMGNCFKLLKLGRADFIVINEHQGRHASGKHYGSREAVRFLDVVLARTGLHMLFPKARDDAETARKRFDRALARIRENGTYHRILARHLDANATPQ